MSSNVSVGLFVLASVVRDAVSSNKNRFLSGCDKVWMDYCVTQPKACHEHCQNDPSHESCCWDEVTTMAVFVVGEVVEDNTFSEVVMVCSVVLSSLILIGFAYLFCCICRFAKRSAPVQPSVAETKNPFVEVDLPKLHLEELDMSNKTNNSPRISSSSTRATEEDARNCMADARSSPIGISPRSISSSRTASPRPQYVGQQRPSCPTPIGCSPRPIIGASPRGVGQQTSSCATPSIRSPRLISGVGLSYQYHGSPSLPPSSPRFESKVPTSSPRFESKLPPSNWVKVEARQGKQGRANSVP